MYYRTVAISLARKCLTIDFFDRKNANILGRNIALRLLRSFPDRRGSAAIRRWLGHETALTCATRALRPSGLLGPRVGPRV